MPDKMIKMRDEKKDKHEIENRGFQFLAELKSGFQFINNKLGFKPDRNSDA